jgi:hypothetical protein
MRVLNAIDLPAGRSGSAVAWQVLLQFCCALLFSSQMVHAQCPNTGETKVIKPRKGSGYFFFKFLGDGSYSYFLDGNTFSMNDKDDPAASFIFIDDFAFEPTLVDRTELAKYATSGKTEDVLRAQAKHQQDYFKSVDPSMVITDYGPSARPNPDGSLGRLFYLWKKESAPGAKPATQYVVSTLVKDGVAVLSLMPSKSPVSEKAFFAQIEKYTSHFDVLTAEQCAKVLAAPTKSE